MSPNRNLRSRYDVVIVGARCAGAATAMLLARRGMQVLVVDRGRYGTDTLSTLALMRGGVLQLHRWGLLSGLESAGTPPIRTTSFHYGDEEIAIPIKPRNGIDALYAPRRTVLDALLVDAARRAGAETLYETRMADVLRSPENRVCGVVLRDSDGQESRIGADWVIGADGLRSTLARLVGAETYETGRHAGGVVYGYWSDLDVEGFHWYYRPGVSAGVIPTNDGQACVFAGVPAQRFQDDLRHDVAGGYYRVLAESAPQLADSLERARRPEKLRGFAGEAGFLRRVWGPGWALVGDAAYFKDPITAHGITDALRDAELLSRAVTKGSERALADYQAARDDLSRDLFHITDYIASFEWDLPTLKEKHLLLSKEMNREAGAVADLDEATPMVDSRSLSARAV